MHLDLSHWIRFGRVIQGRGELPYVDLLNAMREAVRAGRVKVVLSGAQYAEVAKIKDPAQRRSLREVIEDLSAFTYLTSRVDVMKLELEATLNELTGTRGLEWAPIELVGTSALNVLGRVGGLRIMEGEHDITSRLLAEDPFWVERLAKMNLQAERMLLEGPSDEDAADMRADGYQPERLEQQVIDNAALEAEWSKQVEEHRRTHILRDLVGARFLGLELIDMLVREQIVRKIQVDDIFTTPEGGARFLMSMPTSAVTVSMKAQYHQDRNRQWTSNDLYDIDALALTIPYCDVVFADASARDAALRRGLDRHFDTLLPRRPDELTSVLNGLG